MSLFDKATKVIVPIVIAEASLASSSVAETDYAEWAASTAYTLSQKCIKNNRIYERLIAGTSAAAPEADSTNWLDVGPTNRWAMFDDVVGTTTTATTAIDVKIKPGSVSGVALLELVGRTATVEMRTATGGDLVYSKTQTLDGTDVGSFYDWFYHPFVQQANAIFTDLPFHFPNCEVRVLVAGTGTVECGVCKVGEVIDLGATEYNATSGITDYSVKDTDDFGRVSLVKRGFSRRMSLHVMTEKSDFARISRRLAALRATPTVWIATEAPGYDPLTVYGYYKDFSIDVAYPQMHYCSLDIEGLI